MTMTMIRMFLLTITMTMLRIGKKRLWLFDARNPSLSQGHSWWWDFDFNVLWENVQFGGWWLSMVRLWRLRAYVDQNSSSGGHWLYWTLGCLPVSQLQVKTIVMFIGPQSWVKRRIKAVGASIGLYRSRLGWIQWANLLVQRAPGPEPKPPQSHHCCHRLSATSALQQCSAVQSSY